MLLRKPWTELLPRIQAPPEWGIEPVPAEARRLGFLDYAVLWGDLGVGLLVMAAGALLVPGLGLPQALLAIVVGTLLGNLLLAATGYIGSRTGAPTMVLLRPALGRLGSYLPTALNVLQLIGWGAFEILIMAQAANFISARFLGFSSYPFWAIAFALWCTLMAVGGPLVVVRQWLEKFAVWLVLLTTLWLTAHLLTRGTSRRCGGSPGPGRCPSGAPWTWWRRCPSPGCPWWRITTASPGGPAPPSGAPTSGISSPTSGSTASAPGSS